MTRRIILLLSALSVLLSCGRQTRILLDDVETYIDSRPDSALTVLRTVAPENLRGRETKARYSLLYAKALDKNDVDTTDVSIIRPAVDYYGRKRNAGKAAESLMYLGHLQSNAGDYTAAIVTYTEAEKLLEGVDNPHLAALLYSSMSYIYSKSHDRDENLKYAIKSYENLVADSDTVRARQALYYVAQAYMNADEWAVADSLYRHLLADPEVVGTLRGQILSSYGHLNVCKPEPDYRAAAEAFGQAIDLAGSLNSVNHWGSYALASASIGNDSLADAVLSELKDVDSGEYIYWKSMVESVRHNYENAFKDLTSSLLVKDISVIASLSQSVSKAQRDYMMMKNRQKESEIHNKNKSILIIVLSSVIIIGLILISLFVQRGRNRKERDELLQDLETIDAQLQESHRKYDELFRNYRQECQDLRDGYVQMYKTQFDYFRDVSRILLDSDNNGSTLEDPLKLREVNDRLKKMTRYMMSDMDGQRKFEAEIDRLMGGLMTKFRVDYPDLKEEDYRLASLLFVRFDADMISMLHRGQITKHAVHTRKYRLKQMISISEAENKLLYLAMMR